MTDSTDPADFGDGFQDPTAPGWASPPPGPSTPPTSPDASVAPPSPDAASSPAPDAGGAQGAWVPTDQPPPTPSPQDFPYGAAPYAGTPRTRLISRYEHRAGATVGKRKVKFTVGAFRRRTASAGHRP